MQAIAIGAFHNHQIHFPINIFEIQCRILDDRFFKPAEVAGVANRQRSVVFANFYQGNG